MIEIGGDEIMLRFEKLGFIGQQKYVVKRIISNASDKNEGGGK